ncbi:hypothetical protein [Streptomyces albus]|uniref:hypothetical protein n=1 Tax=Streptomyces albus TaxID=1888 RepID=UPI003456C3A4
MTTTAQTHACLRPSAVLTTAKGRSAGLETSGGAAPADRESHPALPGRFLTASQAGAAGPLCAADVTAACHHRLRLGFRRGPSEHGPAARVTRHTTAPRTAATAQYVPDIPTGATR